MPELKKTQIHTKKNNQPPTPHRANQTDPVDMTGSVPQDLNSWEDDSSPAQWKTQDSAW